MKYNIIILSLLLTSAYSNELSFNEAVELVLTQNPTLKIQAASVQDKYGEHVQVGLYPNPIFSYSVENIFGYHHWRGWDNAESRYELAQLVELGGKRQFRACTTKYELRAAQAEYEATTLEVLNRMMKLYVNLVAAQEFLKITVEQQNIAEELLKTVTGKVEAGKVSLIQQNKAEIALSSAQIDFENAKSELISTQEKLAALWGATCFEFDFVNYPFYEIERPIDLDICLQDVCNHPSLLKTNFAYLAANQNYRLEKAETIPNLTLIIGYKTINDTGDKGMILGAALPIPVYDQNQGNIQRAKARIEMMSNLYDETQLDLENRLIIAHNELYRAYNTASLLQSSTLKTANSSFAFAKEGYLEGKFEYIDMLDSQRTLYEVRQKYIEALQNYHHKLADIIYLSIKAD